MPQATKDRVKPTLFIAHPSDMLTDNLPNGDGLIAYNFINELSKRGYRIHIVASNYSLSKPFPSNVTIYQIKPKYTNVLIKRLHYMIQMRIILNKIISNGEEIDIIQQMNPVFAGLSLGLLFCGRPIVLGTYVPDWPKSSRGNDDQSLPVYIVSRTMQKIVCLLQQWHANALLITTEKARERLVLGNLWSSKIFLVPHGIETDVFNAKNNGNGVDLAKTCSILFYSQVDKRKGIFDLIEAIKILTTRLPHVRLEVVGRGDDIGAVNQRIEALKLSKHVNVTGPISRSDAPGIMQRHNVYCLPSYGEPYATTVLEAMSSGMAVVISNAGGLPYMVPQEGGLRVDVGNPVALAAALEKILSRRDMQISMGEMNRRHVELNNSWPVAVDKLESVYDKLMGRN